MSGCPTPRMSSRPPTPRRPPTIPFHFVPPCLHLLPIWHSAVISMRQSSPGELDDITLLCTEHILQAGLQSLASLNSPVVRLVHCSTLPARPEIPACCWPPPRSLFPGGFGIIFGRAQTVLPAVSKVKLNDTHRLAGQGNRNMCAAFRPRPNTTDQTETTS